MTTSTAWSAECDGPALCDESGCITRSPTPARVAPTPASSISAPASFCAICVDGTLGLRPVQLDRGGPVFTICRSCDEDGASATRGYHGIREWRGPSLRGWRTW